MAQKEIIFNFIRGLFSLFLVISMWFVFDQYVKSDINPLYRVLGFILHFLLVVITIIAIWEVF